MKNVFADKRRIVLWILVVLCAVAVLTVSWILLTGAYYALPYHDDYFYALDLRVLMGKYHSNHMLVALDFMSDMYLNFQGCYSGMFIHGFFNPLVGKELIQLRLIALGSAVLMLIGLFLFIKCGFGVLYFMLDRKSVV